MADNEKSPASAPQSAGSVTEGTPTDGGAPPEKSAPSELETRVAALTDQNDKILKQMGEQRSYHDRQMTEMRAVMGATNRGTPEVTNTEDQPTPQQPAVSMREAQREIDVALLKISRDNPLWDDCKADVFAITADSAKSAPFKVMDAQGNVDVYASLCRVQDHVEAQRARKSSQEATEAKDKADTNRVAARSQAHISGSGAGLPVNVKDFDSMTYKEKLEHLRKINPDLFDERDLPESLRK